MEEFMMMCGFTTTSGAISVFPNCICMVLEKFINYENACLSVPNNPPLHVSFSLETT